MISGARDRRIAALLRRELGEAARAISVLAGGQVGHVFRVDTGRRSYVVKFVAARAEPSFAEEPRDDRVYGARWSNLRPAYGLLKHAGVPVPELHASGTVADPALHYAILDYLHGEADDHSADWFAALGRSLGALHTITRPHQGWVAMSEPYPEAWAAAFAASFRSRLAQARPFIGEMLHGRIEALAPGALASLTAPDAYVFSHTDGFQGVFEKADGGWALAGVIDIEDHQFTDQRFVLAGLELSHACDGRTVPPAFWDAYRAQVAVDPGYPIHKTLFQLYYLTVWAWVLKDQPAAFETCLSQLERLTR